MPHVVLLGDSVFDNGAYVGGGPDVIAQLRAGLPEDWLATLCAADGAVIDDVAQQLAGAPPDATHLVLSAGGNDLLGHTDLLNRRATSSAQVLGWFADALDAFEHRYHRMLTIVRARDLPTIACTIYEGNLGRPTNRLAATALAMFNDAIVRAARAYDVPVIELRDVCSDATDFVNAIEPSAAGGAKIARAVGDALYLVR